MKKKRQGSAHNKSALFDFKVKSASGDTIIEGWANKAVVDRGNDLINKDAWTLDNYKKNPIILYNHDKDKPIGKALAIEPTDQGLYIKAKISNSKDPFVSYVRDMIQEGIINSFSVGFDAKDEVKNADGVNEIKGAELYEVSAVTLPMNQDSQFNLSSKDLKGMSYHEAKIKVLKVKGAELAAALQDAIKAKVDGGANADELMAELSKVSGLSADALKAALAGEKVPLSADALKGLADSLGLKVEDLSKIVADEADGGADEAAEGEAPLAPAGDEGEEHKVDISIDTESKADKPKPVIAVIKVPKDAASSVEDASKLVAAGGFDASKPEEQEGFYIFPQDSSASGDNFVDLPIGGGVIASVGIAGMPEKKEVKDAACDDCMKSAMTQMADHSHDQAVAAAISMCKDKCPEQPQKSLSIKAPGAVTTPAGAPSDMPVDDNPYLAQARQTNILLGTLVQEMQKLAKILEGSVDKPVPPQDQQVVADASASKMLDLARKELIELNKRIANLEVKD